MVVTFLQTLLFFSLGATCVYGGLAFINGQLLPSLLGGFYEAVQNPFVRTLIASITIFFGANYFNAKGYLAAGQALGGSMFVVTVVLGMVISALLIDKTTLNSHIVGGVFILLVGALWVVYGLSQS